MIGRTLSHFKITAKLGEGGMGAVYHADDTKLGREVAIKILPEEFTANPERVARFDREAKVLASLDHPNIAGIYEVGEPPAAYRGVTFLERNELCRLTSRNLKLGCLTLHLRKNPSQPLLRSPIGFFGQLYPNEMEKQNYGERSSDLSWVRPLISTSTIS